MSEPEVKETAVAFKTQLGVAVKAMGPDWAREYLEQRSKVSPEDVLDTIARGSKEGNRSCLAIYAEIMGWATKAAQITVAIWQRLGVRDEHEARMRLALAADVEGMSRDDVFAMCCDYVNEECKSRGIMMTFPRGREAEAA